MTLKEYRDSRNRRWFKFTRNLIFAVLVLGVLIAITAAMVGSQAAAEDNAPMPATDGQMQDMMVMMQNTAVWTPQGLVVLQGNRLLHYSPALMLQHTISLPVPTALPLEPQSMPESSDAAVNMAMDEQAQMRSYVSARILPVIDGLIVIRGQQVIWLDSSFKLAGHATLPELPPLTAAELAAVWPLDQPMMSDRGRQVDHPVGPEKPVAPAAPSPRKLEAPNSSS